jgi:stage V sporulation protein S
MIRKDCALWIYEPWLFSTRTQASNARRAPMEVIKVSAHSRSTAVAGAIAGIVRDRGHAEVQAIGASAVNQAVKAAAIARTYLAMDGIEIACLPEFVEVDIEGQERTAVRLVIVTREGSPPPSAPAGS